MTFEVIYSLPLPLDLIFEYSCLVHFKWYYTKNVLLLVSMEIRDNNILSNNYEIYLLISRNRDTN